MKSTEKQSAKKALICSVCRRVKKKQEEEGPRRWKRNSGGDNFHPSSDANRRPRWSCCRRCWIPDVDAGGEERAVVGTGGKACRAEVAAARNVEALTWDAALPSPSPGIASASTAAELPLAAVEAAASFAGFAVVANQSRWIASYSYHGASLSFSLFFLS